MIMPTTLAFHSSAARRSAIAALLLTSALLASCTEAPGVSPAAPGPLMGRVVIAPVLSFVGAAAGSPQADAMSAAFDHVDRFRLIIKRASDGQVVKDTTIVVRPGASSYDLSVPVPAVLPNEQFILKIIAL